MDIGTNLHDAVKEWQTARAEGKPSTLEQRQRVADYHAALNVLDGYEIND